MNNDIKEGYFGKELLNRYIINETVEFHPAAGTLRDVTRQHSEVTLNSPAARCLLLLITKAGGIVSQQEFMDIVWQKNGMNVTPNAYYQNISVLRKGLEKIGLNKEIVVTIPRIGVTLTSDVSIQKITPKVDTVLPVENAEIPIKPVGRLSEKCDVNNPAHPPGTAEEHMERSDEEALVSFKKSTGRYSIIFCFLMAASLILITELYSAKKKATDYFSDYKQVTWISGCSVLMSDRFSLSVDEKKQIAKHYGNEFKKECKKYPWLYITKIPNVQRTSVIRCEQPFEQTTSCISEYYIK